MNIEIKILTLGDYFIAVTILGGITVRGKRSQQKPVAVRNLLWELSSGENDDAMFALELAISGANMNDLLTDGNTAS